MPLPPWVEPWLPVFVPPALKALHATWRVSVHGVEHLGHAPGAPPRVLAVWHGAQIALTPALPCALQRAPLAVMTSASSDGRLQARILNRLGIDTVTGSTSRRGAAALVELGRLIRHGHSALLAVDGPRGPARRARSGALVLARMTGAWVVPVGVRCDQRWTIPETWDAMFCPRPGARVRVCFGPALPPPAPGRRAMVLALRELQQRMEALNPLPPPPPA